MKTMTLALDDADYATIQAEITKRQAEGRTATLPVEDQRSCMAGLMIAEMIRDLDEYRAIFDRYRLTKG